MREQVAAVSPAPPKAPARPPTSATTVTPALRASTMARITSATASSPALASCRRTPPESISSTILRGRCALSRAARNSPTSLAPETSANVPPMNCPSWARQQDVVAIQRAAPDDDAIVEGGGKVELREVAGSAPARSAAGIRGTSRSRGSRRCAGGRWPGTSWRRRRWRVSLAAITPSPSWPDPCIRRSDTVSGRAPPSLMAMCRPPGEARSTKSVTTARQMSPNPPTLVAISILHFVSDRLRSNRASRLPEATTPTMAVATLALGPSLCVELEGHRLHGCALAIVVPDAAKRRSGTHCARRAERFGRARWVPGSPAAPRNDEGFHHQFRYLVGGS